MEDTYVAMLGSKPLNLIKLTIESLPIKYKITMILLIGISLSKIKFKESSYF